MRGRLGDHAYGAVLVTTAAILWSTGGLFVRALGGLDLWTMLAWRSLFTGLSLLALVAVRNRGRTLRAFADLGRQGLVAVPVSAVSMLSYVASLKLTTVANVMIIYAIIPFVAAGIAYLWLGERMGRRAVLASGVALMGVLVMAGSATRPDDLAGNAFAFLMVATFSVLLVMGRRHPGMGMAPVNALACATCALASWPLASGPMPGAHQLAILAVFGATTGGLAYLLFLTGGRHIPSGEAGLIGLLDVVLGPLWVWLAFAEEPSGPALVGGGLVLAAVTWYLAAAPRRAVAPVPG